MFLAQGEAKKNGFSAPRIELGTFRLQSNITVERDTAQVRRLRDC
jgi:hypothetical protein